MNLLTGYLSYLFHFIPIEVGEMNYGFEINGILGFDFMQLAGIIIDTEILKIHKK
ncbi:hypothetical protein DFP98_1365 [Cohnella phaseoli]|uniref:Uncharacterized protein n=1 Tax=Cohnella phaseoli TaxID=456490 RepID=A0A3D9I6T2_9BACL|nr:hypothetical protein DFP98_1365 [Cohnella phaseoli]